VSNAVLDASAVLALLRREVGWEAVAQAIVAGSAMSAVNLAEVVGRLAEDGMDEVDIREVIDRLDVEVISFGADQAFRGGVLQPLTRTLGLSLGDSACLALAESMNLPAITADRIWASLPLPIQVQVVR
jgi:PIN domain nuclease of toxin-antitoxin system